MPGGIDPHVHMHHVVDQARRHAARHRRARAGRPRGAVRRHHDAHRLRLLARRPSRRCRPIETRDKDFVGKSPCDWAYHIMLHSEPPPEFSGQLAEAIQAGYPTLKIFTTNILPSRTGRMVDFGDIWEAFQVLAKEGGLGVIHAEDNDIVMHMYAKLIREDRVGFENLAEVHNQLSEDLSFRRIMRLAESVPGTALYMMHVSAGTGVAAIAEARAQGPADLRRDAAPVPALLGGGLQTAERPDLSHLSVAEVGGGPEGAVARHAQRRDPLRRHRRAVLHAQGQDHRQPDRRHHRRQFRRRAAPRRHVHRDGRAPRLFAARATSTWSRPTPPRSWGSIRGRARSRSAATPTSPSSIPTRRGKVRAADLHETDYTPWEGHDIFAWPVVTILRGKVMVENGQYFGSPSDGRYLKRKISSEILERGAAVSEAPNDLACELLAQSLAAWRVAGSVERASDGALVIGGRRQRHPDRSRRRRIRCSAGWSRSMAASAAAISLVAVLRQVREALDPGYAANRVRIAVAPLVPS